MNQLTKEISYLLQSNQNNEQEIVRLKDVIGEKTNDIQQCKDRIILFDKYIKEFKVKEEDFKQELQQTSTKFEGEVKHLKKINDDLEDKNDKL